MEFLLDAFVEFFIEIFGEAFISLSAVFVPKKRFSEKTKKMTGNVFMVLSAVLFLGLFIGIVILFVSNGKSFWGWFLISLFVVFLLTGIILKIVSRHIVK